MKSSEIRQKFFDFFESKGHKIVSSAPMVVKDDPTLMFTNAGMNQFKEYFLGNSRAEHQRIANTQKCLRVSGKHNDLEEVGIDTYHHTMFEMLGNWSFGDPARPDGGYFKKEAIEWGWEFLNKVMGIPEDRLYATYFGGDETENLDPDSEALGFWKNILPDFRIIPGSKKDNFWEMGDTGPCGPCSEIHADLRSEDERKKIPGEKLVNTGHPEVIEIWNLVFIQFNRNADGSLVLLPGKHVDTGMGFERLCRVLQGVNSNYDSDIFQPFILEMAKISGKSYKKDEKTDIALRVIADHIRAIAFSIADGQLPSNNKAGYVIRRILRRAVRYGYTYLSMDEPFLYKLVPVLAGSLGIVFPELIKQKDLIEKVIREEETGFLKTLENGIRLLNEAINEAKSQKKNIISGISAFELYDTYGFPIDLTELMARENNMTVDLEEFSAELSKQKERSRAASSQEISDWVILNPEQPETQFVGYDVLKIESRILRYRKIKTKQKDLYQIILDKTPFYAESGGQVGDRGILKSGDKIIEIIDTLKENNMTVHISETLPDELNTAFSAEVDVKKRKSTMKNHSATHLLHHALRAVSGSHIEQKGSLVEPDRLRFDFSHFQKLTEEELEQIEHRVNEKIMENIPLEEFRNIAISEAKAMGAMALFGEKYGDKVRTIRFGDSVELCGGTHVKSTGEIGFFKILTESSIAAGIRRIEAITGENAYHWIQQRNKLVSDICVSLTTNSDNLQKTVDQIVNENKNLRKELEQLLKEKNSSLGKELIDNAFVIRDVKLICKQIEADSPDSVKDLVFSINKASQNTITLLGAAFGEKANIWLMISSNLLDRGLNAVDIIKQIGKEINGGGGGQPFFATAGGKNPAGILNALEAGKLIITKKIDSYEG